MSEPCFNRARRDFIPVARPSVTAAEVSAVVGALRDVQLSQGPRVEQFESRFAAMHGCAHGIATNSGTTAIHLAIEALGLRWKRIACPTMAMVAVPNAIISAGSTPVFVDSDPACGNIDLDALADLAAAGQIDAAIVIHLYGVPAEIDRDFPVPLLEDCCEAHAANFANGEKIGSRGAAACFSFYANKIICTGEGGMVTTSDTALADRCRLLRAHAFTPQEHFHHTAHAFGYRMTEMSGAIGCAQLDRMVPMLLQRARLVKAYHHGLAGLDWLDYQYRPVGSANWVMPAMISRRFASRMTVPQVREHLAAAGIETRRWFKPMHMQPHLEQFVLPGQCFEVAEDLWERGFYLPLFHDLEVADVERICTALRSV
jgi:perosamine synthetase